MNLSHVRLNWTGWKHVPPRWVETEVESGCDDVVGNLGNEVVANLRSTSDQRVVVSL